MPVKSEQWKDFEVLISEIEKQTAPQGAIVRHNHRVKGKAGRLRQLDVTISAKVGLHPIFIVIECKRYTRPVSIDKVEGFATKLQDVSASQGIMISVTGFDEGARAMAQDKRITLLSYREAQEVDWQTLVAPDSWVKLTFIELHESYITLNFAEPNQLDFDLSTVIIDEDGEYLFTLRELFDNSYQPLSQSLPIGPVTITVQMERPCYVQTAEGKLRLNEVVYEFVRIAKEYIVNLRLMEGHVLENSLTQEVAFRQVFSEGFNIHEIMKQQQGRVLSAEEFNNREGEVILQDFNIHKYPGYFRLEISQKIE